MCEYTGSATRVFILDALRTVCDHETLTLMNPSCEHVRDLSQKFTAKYYGWAWGDALPTSSEVGRWALLPTVLHILHILQ